MASNYTANYQLNQWEGSDKVLREEFNADNAKLDAALAELVETAAGKAGQADTQAALSALQTQVDAKAAQTDLSALQTQVNAKAAQTDLNTLSSALTAGLAKKYGTDNPYIKVGTYTGNGGASVTVTTGFQPSLVIILSLSASGSYDYGLLLGNGTAQFLETLFNSRSIYTDALQCTSTGFTVTHTVGSSYVGFNTSGCNCLYFAFR